MTLWAAIMNQFMFATQQNLLLQVINIAIIVIAAWIVVEGVVKFFVPGGTSLQRPETITTTT